MFMYLPWMERELSLPVRANAACRPIAARRGASSAGSIWAFVQRNDDFTDHPRRHPRQSAASFFFKSSGMSVSSWPRASTETSLPSWSTTNIAGIELIPHDLENSPSQYLPW